MVENQNSNPNSNQKEKTKRIRLFDGRVFKFLISSIGVVKRSFIDYLIDKCDNQSELDKYYILDDYDNSFITIDKYLAGYEIVCIEHDKKYSELDVIVAKCNDNSNECEIKLFKFPRYA